MKMNLKSVLAATAMAGAAVVMFPEAASAAAVGVSVGVAMPAPIVVVSPYGPDYVAYDDQFYYDPIYISGAWYHGPYRWRMHDGQREFLVEGSWHRNEWRDNTFPETITFHNGGRYAAGRNEGFEGASRINARFHAVKADMRQDRREDRQDARHDEHEKHDGDGASHN